MKEFEVVYCELMVVDEVSCHREVVDLHFFYSLSNRDGDFNSVAGSWLSFSLSDLHLGLCISEYIAQTIHTNTWLHEHCTSPILLTRRPGAPGAVIRQAFRHWRPPGILPL